MAEQDAFRKEAAHNQFLSSLFQGIGGALLFGFVSSLVIGGGAVAATLPIWGLAAIPIVGIGCIFAGTRFSLEAQLLSQKLSARLMSSAIAKKDGPGPELAPTVSAPEPVLTLPPGMKHSRAQDKHQMSEPSRPTSLVQEIAFAEPMQEKHRALA